VRGRPRVKLQMSTRLALYSALEFASDLTRHIAADEIPQRYGVSSHHLAKVLSELARAGVVECARGAERRPGAGASSPPRPARRRP